MVVAADPPLADSDAEGTRLWSAFAGARGVEARNRLVEHYLPLARTVAATLYARRGGLAVEFQDYLQLATLGLIEAVERFDPSLGHAFATFATPRMRGSILNGLEALSEQYTQIGLRKRLEEERLQSLRPAADGSAGRRARGDLLGSLADLAVGLALSRLLEGSGMMAAHEAEPSYRQEFYERDELRQLRASLAALVRALPDQERRVVWYHYYHGLGFTEIATLFDLSKGRISQIHRQALQLLHEAHASVGRVDARL